MGKREGKAQAKASEAKDEGQSGEVKEGRGTSNGRRGGEGGRGARCEMSGGQGVGKLGEREAWGETHLPTMPSSWGLKGQRS